MQLGVAGMALLFVAAPASSQAPSNPSGVESVARGRAIFIATCRGCHTVSPPPQAAPPMSLIAKRYLTANGSRDAAAARIAEWLAAPSAEKSILPKAEVARFGVMPHQPLAEAGRFSVAAYVLSLADSAPGAPGRRKR